MRFWIFIRLQYADVVWPPGRCRCYLTAASAGIICSAALRFSIQKPYGTRAIIFFGRYLIAAWYLIATCTGIILESILRHWDSNTVGTLEECIEHGASGRGTVFGIWLQYQVPLFSLHHLFFGCSSGNSGKMRIYEIQEFSGNNVGTCRRDYSLVGIWWERCPSEPENEKSGLVATGSWTTVRGSTSLLYREGVP